jgi:UDP-N-acetylglucosamine 2-epimerase (non-hydrolysing)
LRKLRPLLILGTRPEAIKMAPVAAACRSRGEAFAPTVLITGQHRELLAPVVEYFGIAEDVWLDLMTPNQSLAQLTARCLEGIDETIVRYRPDCVVVQGDTTTAMAASLAAFYRRTPLVHVEAGLRTGDLQCPWPEELNRRITDLATSLHCAPTQRAADALPPMPCWPRGSRRSEFT